MSGRFCLIELMGQGRAVGHVTDHPGGGFYVAELRPASQGFAARYYLGPCAIYRMHDVTEDVARATVNEGRVSATTLPSWASKGITTPAPLPPPKPLPTLTVKWLHATFRIPGDSAWWTIDAIGSDFVLAEKLSTRETCRVKWCDGGILDLTELIPF